MTDVPDSTIQPTEDNADDPDRPPGLSIDWQLYEHYLEDSSLSEKDKRALIETLWSIMVSFVDLGFCLSPTREICGEVDPLAALAEKSIGNVVKLEDTNKKFNEAADGTIALSRKESANES
ncbi:MAG: hypothetical protein ACR2RE_28020 [Geminicoccaceae bacterium]